MADSSGRSIIGARRVPSTSLNEDYYTFVRGGGSGVPGPHQHSLRPVESRFSLREQFSTTRREIEFGFDDTSSILERSTLASVDLENEPDDAAVVNEASSSSLMPPPPRPSHNPPPIHRSHYELLCLPNDPSLTPNDIRRAFHRTVQNLCVDRQPNRLQVAAASYLGQVQIAFETLIEPYKRAEYDMSLTGEDESSLPAKTFHEDAAAYQASVLEQYMLLGPGGLRTTTDIGMRVDTTSLLGQGGQRTTKNDRSTGGPAILDLSLRQSITTDLPALREPLENTINYIRELTEKNIQPSSSPTKRPVHHVHPTLSITGSTHGLLDEPFKLASILRDGYQPPGPSIHGPRRLDQLLTSRFLPGLNITARQEFFLCEDAQKSTLEVPDSVLEQELEVLPYPSVTLRAGHSIKTSGKTQKEPVNIEVSIQKPLLSSQTTTTIPTIDVALDKRIGPGTAFLVADAGDWDQYIWPTPKECRELSKFSELSSPSSTPTRYLQNMTSKNSNITNPFRNAPTVEVGYAFGSHANVMGVRAGSNRAFTKPSERGLRGMDDYDLSTPRRGNGNSDSDTGSWTISTGLTSGTAAAYLRYGKDLFTSSLSRQDTKTQTKTNSKLYAPIKKSGFRTEIELSATKPTNSLSKSLSSIFTLTTGTQKRGDILLAFRTLRYIGRFTKIGFEIGITANNLHFSLYWSRLGQRVSIPFLFAATGGTAGSRTTIGGNSKLIFWTTVVPFAAFAVWEGVLRRLWNGRKKKQQGKKERELLKGGGNKKEILTSGGGGGSGSAGEDMSSSSSLVARQRAEADELTVILATGVENRQRCERQRGGLVILSAKYGVLSGFVKGHPQPQPQQQQQPAVLGEEENEAENEIADVTVALAAIIDEEGRLDVPAGLNKGRLLGFWDPAPNSKGKKALWVRYLYRGRESVVEIGESEGVCLP